jgi:hypothetical protein
MRVWSKYSPLKEAFILSSLLWLSHHFTLGYLLVSSLWVVNLINVIRKTSFINDIEKNLLFLTLDIFYVIFSKLPIIKSKRASYILDHFKTREPCI